MTDPNDPHLRQPRGQILVLFAGGLVALLAIGALVLDIGSVVMTRRHEQNAADTAALAAARYIQPTATTPAGDTASMWTAACFYAKQNGFFPNAADCRNDPSGDVLTVNYPPSRNAGQYAGFAGYVEVTVGQPHDSFLAAIVGIRRFTVSTGAVAAFDTGSAGSSSLIALNPTACGSPQGTVITGNTTVDIHPATGVVGAGGYVQIDSLCTNSPPDGSCVTGSGQGALDVKGGSTLNAPDTYVVGSCFGGGSITGGPLQEGANYVGDPLSQLRLPVISPPGASCPDGTPTTPSGAEGCTLKGATPIVLNPGVYYGGWTITTANVNITLNPGIYIIAGGGIKQKGGTVSSAGGRVLIISTDDPAWAQACKTGGSHPPTACQDVINFGGAADLSLHGLDNSPCPPTSSSGCPYAGMLLWQDGGGSNPTALVTLEGGASLSISGTIYAPEAQVNLTGNGLTTGCTGSGSTNCAGVQIISDTFQISGGGTLDMPYDPSDFYHLNSKGLVK